MGTVSTHMSIDSKKRSQFRVASKNIGALYETVEAGGGERNRSAEWHSAVSQVGNLRADRRAADYQSAIQQTSCRRYFTRRAGGD
jgi:hypothetical protein